MKVGSVYLRLLLKASEKGSWLVCLKGVFASGKDLVGLLVTGKDSDWRPGNGN